MASARLARFATEAAPPQFVSVMRNRASKMLETIHEEERESSAYAAAATASMAADTISSMSTLGSSQAFMESKKAPSSSANHMIFKGFKDKIPIFRR